MSRTRSKSGWPRTAIELRDEGYVPQGKAFRCDCGRKIFIVSTPTGGRMPLETREDERFQSHFASCTTPDRFRRRNEPDQRQGSLFETGAREPQTVRYPD